MDSETLQIIFDEINNAIKSKNPREHLEKYLKENQYMKESEDQKQRDAYDMIETIFKSFDENEKIKNDPEKYRRNLERKSPQFDPEKCDCKPKATEIQAIAENLKGVKFDIESNSNANLGKIKEPSNGLEV